MAEPRHDLSAYPDTTHFTMPTGVGTEEFLFPDHDTYRRPETPEGWHGLAVTSMHILADLGQQTRKIRENEGESFDISQSVPVRTSPGTTVEYHYDDTSDGSTSREIVKVYLEAILPMPLSNRPPDMDFNTWLTQLKAADDRYEQERAEMPELDWINPSQGQPEEVLVVNGPHCGKKLHELDVVELQRMTERLQGAALMGAIRLRRYDLATQVANLRGPDAQP